jgi:DNA-binding CsgD family transcriptional regulator
LGRLDDALTPRQLEVLELAATGMSSQQIADRLVIAERTVREHMRVILGKLQCQNRTEAVIVAIRTGVLTFNDTPSSDQLQSLVESIIHLRKETQRLELLAIELIRGRIDVPQSERW